MSKEQEQLQALQQEIEKYNKQADRWGYSHLWFDIKVQRAIGFCAPKEEENDSKYLLLNILRLIKCIIVNIIMRRKFNSVMKACRRYNETR